MSNVVHRVGQSYESEQKNLGSLVLVIRRDTSEVGKEASDFSIAADNGDYTALTVDKLGYLRVNVPAAGVVVSEARTIEDRLEEMNSLLRRVVLALEMLHGTRIEDPQQ